MCRTKGHKAKAVWLHVFVGVCKRVYRWPSSPEGAAVLLIHGHFVLHWVTDWNCTLPAFLDGWQRAALGRVQLEEMTLSPARSQSGGAHCQPQQYSVENGSGATQSSSGSAWFRAEGVVQLAALISTCHGASESTNCSTKHPDWPCEMMSPTNITSGMRRPTQKTSCYETNGDSSKGQWCIMLKQHKKRLPMTRWFFFIFQRYRCTNKTFFY